MKLMPGPLKCNLPSPKAKSFIQQVNRFFFQLVTCRLHEIEHWGVALGRSGPFQFIPGRNSDSVNRCIVTMLPWKSGREWVCMYIYGYDHTWQVVLT
jgi:hypothetical protein